jgi:hypothetical protein
MAVDFDFDEIEDPLAFEQLLSALAITAALSAVHRDVSHGFSPRSKRVPASSGTSGIDQTRLVVNDQKPGMGIRASWEPCL